MNYQTRASHPSWGGILGTPEVHERLKRAEAAGAIDVRGDGYYRLPEGPIIHLYEDGTWDVDNYSKR